MGGKETIECQINCYSINQSILLSNVLYKTVDNKIIEFPLHLTDSTFNNITDSMHLITFFILTLLHMSAKLVCTACYIYWLIHFKLGYLHVGLVRWKLKCREIIFVCSGNFYLYLIFTLKLFAKLVLICLICLLNFELSLEFNDKIMFNALNLKLNICCAVYFT